MSRMYSSRRGKHGSKKPLTSAVKSQVKLKPQEIEKLVLKLSKEGVMPSKIGLILRDQYGVPSAEDITGKKVNKILAENKQTLEIPEDLFSLMKRAAKVRKHLDAAKKDNLGRRGLNLIESKIFRLSKYYIRTKRLPEGWRYSPEKAKLLIE